MLQPTSSIMPVTLCRRPPVVNSIIAVIVVWSGAEWQLVAILDSAATRVIQRYPMHYIAAKSQPFSLALLPGVFQ